MSSNLILKDGIIEKTTNKKSCKKKGVAKKMSLESDKKKPNKDEIWKKQSNLNLTLRDEIEKKINKKTM